MDFTPGKYKVLICALKGCSFPFTGFSDLLAGQYEKFIILRHDVDKKPENAVTLAGIEAEESIRASYHFRSVEGEFQKGVITQIAGLGHEIAYHYEDLSAMSGIKTGRLREAHPAAVEEAVARFRRNLDHIRQLYPVNVISMHGSPLSPVDNRLLWKYHDYHSDGIVCEPYMDIDMSDVLYLTDTGRRWDGDDSNVRDRGFLAGSEALQDPYADWRVKPVRGSLMNMTPEGMNFRASFKASSTDELIESALNKRLPGRIIINTHPQRWTDDTLSWATELIIQNFKNQVKRLVRLTKIMV